MSTLKYLLEHGSATRPQIAAAIGASTPSLLAALSQLEEAGYVTADLPARERVGRAVTYTADRRRVVEDAALLTGWLAEGPA